MFWLLVIFAVICQLSTATASLNCLECDEIVLELSSSSNIDTTNCSSSQNLTQACQAVLSINYASDNAQVTFGGDSDNLSQGKNMIKHNMRIMLNNKQITRTLELFCVKNDSCLLDMKKIYDKSKYSK